MAPSPCPDPTVPATDAHHPGPLAATDGALLLDIADDSIRSAFEGRQPALPAGLPAVLWECRGAFVTLHVAGALNGCIGAVTADEPLAPIVARLARSAAFDDPRLPPATPDDLAHLSIEVSILSPLEPVPAPSPAALQAQLTPGVHGLVVAEGRHRGLFLPDVWAQLPAFDDFVRHLFVKAGLDPHRWPGHLTAWRFTTQAFIRPAPGSPLRWAALDPAGPQGAV